MNRNNVELGRRAWPFIDPQATQRVWFCHSFEIDL